MSRISLLSNSLDLNQMCAYVLGYHWCDSHIISQDVWMKGTQFVNCPFQTGPHLTAHAHILCILPRTLADQGLFSLVSSSLWLSQSFCLLSYRVPDPEGERFDGDISFRTQCAKVSYFAQCPVVVYCICSTIAGRRFSDDAVLWPVSTADHC